ncbi:MAG TPA: hypothetical protein VNU01_06055 [Egibacteraceae bacterium]|nr:hypothetical protein [Egibacteraceae bacterium]
MNGWDEMMRQAGRQYGLIERTQAHGLGMSADALAHRARKEGWPRPQRGVFALPGSADTPERRILAAVLAVQGDAWATRLTAAYVWGLHDRLRVPLTLLVPHQHRAAVLERATVMRTRNLSPEDVTVRRALPVVTAARMIADLCGVLPIEELRGLAIAARQMGLLRPEELWALWERFQGSPRHRKLRALATMLSGDVERVDSMLEHRVRALLRRYGLPLPYPEPFPVRAGGRVIACIDIAWPAAMVGVECDGFRYHSKAEDLEKDTRRQNQLVTLGWQLVRVTWRQMEREPELIASAVHRLLVGTGAVSERSL